MNSLNLLLLKEIRSTNEDVSTRDQPENSEEHQPLSNPGNKYLQEAIKYLTEHRYRPNEQSEENGTRAEVMEVGWGSEEETGFSDNEHSKYRMMSPLRKKGYCFDFQRTGACSRKNCKFMHINSRSSYPDYSQRAVDTQRTEQSKSKQRDLKSCDIGNRKFSGNRSRNGPRTLRKSSGSYSNNICFNYQNHGRCHFGKRCRFLHIENDHFNSKPRYGENRYANFNKQNNFNSQCNFNGVDNTNVQNDFLGEMRELLNSLKTMVEGQKQSGQGMVFPSQQPQGQQPPHLLPYVSPGTQFFQTVDRC